MTPLQAQTPKARRGCIFYACIVGSALLLMTLVIVLLGLHYVKSTILRFTDSKPIELPTVQMSQAEALQVKQRFESFQQAVREQRPAKPLALTADEINALISGGAEQGPWKGKVYVSFEGEQLKGEVSVPLQDIGMSMFPGRYLNGSATFSLSFRNGRLALTPQTIQAKGQPLPNLFMKQIRKQNLAGAVTNDPSVVQVLKGLEEIKVDEGKLVLGPKQQP